MTLSSGNIPYDYEYGHGAFHAPNPYTSDYPIGLSGILLEQAQFVITAELRKWKKFDGNDGSHTLPDLHVFKNIAIAPSGPYEPKTNGSTLGNAIAPGCINFIDHIQETRTALETLFVDELSADANDDYFVAWLSALYPNNPSGALGLYSRRLSSEIGVIDYALIDVLGGSGVLYDVDFGELMFNPFPHISNFQLDSAHEVNDSYNIQQGPLFPAFQKTNGTLVPLTGREPSIIHNSWHNYLIDPIGSGTVMINGYCLQPDTKYYLNNGGYVFNVTTSPAFTHFAASARNSGNGGNIPTSRVYVTPTAQGSGVYRILSINKHADFPNTTIPSGTVSSWPPLTAYPDTGYHVFDDCLWITDNTNVSQTVAASTILGRPSGLTILSPYDMTKLWVRYADQTKYGSFLFGGAGITRMSNWASGVALIRSSPDNIYRFNENIQKTTNNNTSGQFRLARYNDSLDYLTDITTTSSVPWTGADNLFPLAGTTEFIHDVWYDPGANEYWVSNLAGASMNIWKFDSSFAYINKYAVNPGSGMASSRGVFINGQHYFYRGESVLSGGQSILSSGIYAVSFGADGTEPFDNTANEPKVGVLYTFPENAKFINGAPFVGVQQFCEIMDMLEVTSSTHLIPGVYALVRWVAPGGNPNSLYILRLEETATAWEIRAITGFESGLPIIPVRREFLYMDY